MFNDLIKEYKQKNKFNKMILKLFAFELIIICVDIYNLYKYNYKYIFFLQLILLYLCHIFFVKIYYKYTYKKYDKKILEDLLKLKKIHNLFTLWQLKKFLDDKNDMRFNSVWIWWFSLIFSLFLKCLASSGKLEQYNYEFYTIFLIFYSIIFVNYIYYFILISNNKYMLYFNFKDIYQEIYINRVENNKVLKLIDNIMLWFE